MHDEAMRMIRAKRGLMLRIANGLKISPSAVVSWKRVPPLRVLRVEELSAIPRHVLRPDLYPPPKGKPNGMDRRARRTTQKAVARRSKRFTDRG